MNEKKCIAVDFDGTLVLKDAYPNIGKPNWPVVEKIKQLQADGHDIFLWTCRVGNSLQEAVDFCRDVLGITFTDIQINTNRLATTWDSKPCKPVADYYVDDRALSLTEFLNKKDFESGRSVVAIIEQRHENEKRKL